MTTTNDSLALSTRERTGSTSAKALRGAGSVPAVLYGHGDPTPVTIDAKALDDLLAHGGKNHLLAVTVDGKPRGSAIVRDVQRDPVTRRVLAADLQRVDATEEIHASVPLVTTGVANGVKNDNGVMDVVVHTLDVTGPANAVPEQIEVDVTSLGVHDHITVADLKLPPKFKASLDPSTVLVTIEPSKTEALVAEAQAEAAETAAAAAEAAPVEPPATEGSETE